MKLALVSLEKDGVVRLAAEGQITMVDFPAEGKNPIEAATGVTWASNRVLLNFEKVSYIDSAGIGWLITCHRAFKNGGGTLVLHSVPAHIRQVFDLLKIGKLIPVAADETAARALLHGGRQ